MTDITPIERKWLDGRDIQALKDEYESLCREQPKRYRNFTYPTAK